jgi:hypothetical protein
LKVRETKQRECHSVGPKEPGLLSEKEEEGEKWDTEKESGELHSSPVFALHSLWDIRPICFGLLLYKNHMLRQNDL